jgi:hypothetical protein
MRFRSPTVIEPAFCGFREVLLKENCPKIISTRLKFRQPEVEIKEEYCSAFIHSENLNQMILNLTETLNIAEP